MTCKTRMKRIIGTAAIAAALAIAGLPATMRTAEAQTKTAQSTPKVDYKAILAAPDRSEADRANDKKRHAAELLAFTGVTPGMTVLDMGAGGGYSTELLARAVGSNGKVLGQNPPDGGSAKALAAFDKRAQTPAMKNVIADKRPYDDPLAEGVKDFDLITFFFAYHDTTYMPIDRAKMNKKMFDALKSGGILVIADHAAKEGDGTSVGKTLHRIEEKALRGEIEAAGFKFVEEGRFLRNPKDPHDKPVFRSPIPVDEFVLKFKKP